MKKILITGGAGFLGSNLCRELLKSEDTELVVLDNFFSGRRENLADISEKRLKIIEHDVCESFQSPDKIDEIYHLACPASPPFYQTDPIKTTRCCFEGALNMLELAKEHNAKILFSSTSEVYGEPQVHPQLESYRGNVNPHGIRSCYDEGKRVAESLFFDYNRIYGTKIKVVRIFNTYGPYMRPDDGRVVSNFILQALSDEPITIYGDGMQSRSFCYVADLMRGLIGMMASDEDFPGPVNLGNPVEFSMLELAKQIIKLCNSKSKLKFLPLPEDDPTRRRPDITLAMRKLNWSPEVQLTYGLEKTVKFFAGIK